MKKVFVVILAICAALYLSHRINAPQSVTLGDASVSPNWSSNRSSQKSSGMREHLTKARENSIKVAEAEDMARRAKSPDVTHTITDFRKGTRNNLVIHDALCLDKKTPAAGESNGYRFSGSYFSPQEQTAAPFDTLAISYQVSLQERSTVQIAFRTQGEDGAWSDWQHVSEDKVNFPIALGRTAVSWQYQLTLLASEIAVSPRIYNVSIHSMNLATTTASLEPTSESEYVR